VELVGAEYVKDVFVYTYAHKGYFHFGVAQELNVGDASSLEVYVRFFVDCLLIVT